MTFVFFVSQKVTPNQKMRAAPIVSKNLLLAVVMRCATETSLLESCNAVTTVEQGDGSLTSILALPHPPTGWGRVWLIPDTELAERRHHTTADAVAIQSSYPGDKHEVRTLWEV